MAISDGSMILTRRQFLQQFAGGAAIALSLPGTAVAREISPQPNVVFLEPSDADFARHRVIFNKRFTQTPRVIAVCSEESGVIEAVRYAKTQSLPIAIKSGGHSFEGFSINEGGMVIDLSTMNNLALAADNSLRAGPGCRLAQVSDRLLSRGRLLPVGACGGVGLSGLTLGGGYGLFSRNFGLTCDSLKRVRMVDAEGQLHDTRDNPELLWACRGGGNGGLGVIIQLEYATHPAPKVLHSFRYRHHIVTAQDAVSLASRWAGLMRDLPPQAYSALIANGKTITILVTTFLPGTRYGPIAMILSSLAANAAKVEEPRSEPLAVALKRYTGQKGPLFFKNASGGFYKNSPDMGAAATAIFQAVLEQPGIIFQINTFGPLPAAPESAFPHRDFAFIGELQAYWDKPAEAARAMDTIASLQRSLTASGVQAHYANYPDLNLSNWAHAYYGKNNYERLQALKKRYDPGNAFQHPQSIQLPK